MLEKLTELEMKKIRLAYIFRNLIQDDTEMIYKILHRYIGTDFQHAYLDALNYLGALMDVDLKTLVSNFSTDQLEK